MKGSPFQVGTVLGEASEGVKKQTIGITWNQMKYREAYTEVPYVKEKNPRGQKKIFEVIMTENIPHLIKTFIYKTK